MSEHEHAWSVTLDHARGGWFAECSCGWMAERPTYYRARSVRWAKRHVEGTLRGAA
jgi:hypothetical protein